MRGRPALIARMIARSAAACGCVSSLVEQLSNPRTTGADIDAIKADAVHALNALLKRIIKEVWYPNTANADVVRDRKLPIGII